MNRNGTHLGRPAYTADQRMQVSTDKFFEGLYKHPGVEGHWFTDRVHFPVPGGKRVRRQAFSWRVHNPEDTLYEGDRVVVTCEAKWCVNPDHLKLMRGPKGEEAAAKIKDPNGVAANEKWLRTQIAREEDPAMRALQQAALDRLLAKRAE